VKSAYRLAMAQKGTGAQTSSSTAGVDDRSSWDLIWKAAIPEKVKIFAWRVATNTLATKVNKCKRTLETDNTCTICGHSDENEYHAVVACTKSRALRHEMRKHWNLPKEQAFWHTGVDWLQVLLNRCDGDSRNKILLLLWRAWHLRENIVHGDGKEHLMSSVSFLVKYEHDFRRATDRNNPPGHNCGQDLYGDRRVQAPVAVVTNWIPPPPGVAKLNTDAAFEAQSGVSACGAIARNGQARVWYSCHWAAT
jgi:hypothetical protein